MWRQLRAAPVFSLTVITVVAISVGAGVLFAKMTSDALFTPSVPRESGRVLRVYTVDETRASTPAGRYGRSSLADFEDIETRLRPHAMLAAYFPTRVSLALDEASVPVEANFVTTNYFRVTAIRPVVGAIDSADRVGAVISYDLWVTLLRKDPSILQRTLNVNGAHVPVRAVAEAGFEGTDYGRRVDLWLPVTAAHILDPSSSLDVRYRDDRTGSVIGRLNAGETVLACDAMLQTIGPELEKMYPETNARRGFTAVPYPHAIGPAERASLGIGRLISGSALTLGALLVLSYANLINLFAMRNILRRRDVAIRKALGGSEWRLIKELLGEIASLVLPAILVASAIALLPLSHVLAQPASRSAPQTIWIASLAAGFGGLIAMMALGTAPAMWTHAQSPMAAMRSPDNDQPLRNARVIWGLVSVQVAVACCSFAAVYASIARVKELEAVKPGFAVDELIDVRVQVKTAGESQQVLTRAMAALPTVQSIAIAETPLLGDKPMRMPIDVSGTGRQPASVRFDVVSPNYFSTIGLPILVGGFTSNAQVTPTFSEAVVNRAFAKALLSPGRELGTTILLRERYPVRVVGIAENAVADALTDGEEPRIYLAKEARSNGEFELLLRTRGPAERDVAAVERGLASSRAISRQMRVEALSDRRDRIIEPVRNIARTLSVLMVALALLVAIGVYGILSVAITSRQRANAIKIALGAQPHRIVIGAIRPAAISFACGIAIAGLFALLTYRVAGPSGISGVGFLLAIPIILLPIAIACVFPLVRLLRQPAARILRMS